MAVFDHQELSLDHLIEFFQQTSVRSTDPKSLVHYISDYLFYTFQFRGISFFETLSADQDQPKLVYTQYHPDCNPQERETLIHGINSSPLLSEVKVNPIGTGDGRIGFFTWIHDSSIGHEYDSLQEDLLSVLSLIIENAYIQFKQQIMLEEIVGIQLELFNARTRGGKLHTQNVQRLALTLAREMNLSRKELDDLSIGGLLFDIGKIGIPDAILNKAEPLSPKEKKTIKKHVHYGQEIIHSMGTLSKGVNDIVLLHHELLNGSGYPAGIQARDIPLIVRVITVCDVYCALREDRVYRKAWTQQDAYGMLLQGAGSLFDSEIVRILGVREREIHG